MMKILTLLGILLLSIGCTEVTNDNTSAGGEGGDAEDNPPPVVIEPIVIAPGEPEPSPPVE